MSIPLSITRRICRKTVVFFEVFVRIGKLIKNLEEKKNEKDRYKIIALSKNIAGQFCWVTQNLKPPLNTAIHKGFSPHHKSLSHLR